MADPFQPKFVDLVRNYTTTTGTGNIVLGQPVAGHDSLAQAVAAGDRFFYCIAGVDKPAEREVGRGTMQSNGTVSREPIGGGLTNFTTGSKTIALVAGAEWFTKVGSWINGGAESLAALATTNKSSLVGAVNELAASSGGGASAAPGLTFVAYSGSAIASTVKRVDTIGYSVAGSGAARYIYDAAVNSTTAAANPRTQFLAADGRGFKLDPEQRLTIEMFGGRGDAVCLADGKTVTSGTFNDDALTAALNFANYQPVSANIVFAREIHFGLGGYRFASSWNLKKIANVIGLSTGQIVAGSGAPTTCFFPADTVGVYLNSFNHSAGGFESPISTSASGSRIKGIAFVSAGGTNRAKHAMWVRTQCVIEDCAFFNFPGNGLHVVGSSGGTATTDGAANGAYFKRLYVAAAGGHGIYVAGADANAMVFEACQIAGAGWCGIYNTSFYSNKFTGIEIDGFGNSMEGYASYGGQNYILISDTPNIGNSTTPGTNRTVWYPDNSGSSYPAWTAARTYTPGLPILDTGSGCVYDCTYQEGHLSHIVAPSMAIGGTMGCTSLSAKLTASVGGTFTSGNGFGTHLAVSTGSLPTGHALGTDIAVDFGLEAKDGGLFRFNYQGNGGFLNELKVQGSYRVEMSYGGPAASWGWTLRNTTTKFGKSSEIVEGAFFANRFALGSPFMSGIEDYRMFGYAAAGSGGAAPTTTQHVSGEILWNQNPYGGNPIVGRGCIAAGTPGTWRHFASFTFKGDTASRPGLGAGDAGVQYFDTTLAAAGKPIWWTGAAWVDASGASA